MSKSNLESKKIWLFSEFFYPIVTSTGYYMTELAIYFARRMNVGVICMGANYNAVQSVNFKKEEIYEGINIYRILNGDINKDSFVKRTIRLLWASWNMFIKAVVHVKKGDVLFVVTNPAFLIVFMPILKVLKQSRYILLVHDVFPENLVALGQIQETSLGYSCMKRFFDYLYSKTDVNISIGRDMNEVIGNKTKNRVKTYFIPNWSEVDVIFPVDKENTDLYKKSDKVQNKFIFQFAGNLGKLQGIDNLLDSIGMLENQNICFLFIGAGARCSYIKEQTEHNNNIILMNNIDRSRQNDFLNACDVAIITLTEGMYGLGVPSKSYNIMATGKPILFIGDKNSEIAICIKEYDLGWVVEPNNPIELKNVIEQIYSKRNLLFEYRQRVRSVAETVFAKDIILEKYFQILSETL